MHLQLIIHTNVVLTSESWLFWSLEMQRDLLFGQTKAAGETGGEPGERGQSRANNKGHQLRLVMVYVSKHKTNGLCL